MERAKARLLEAELKRKGKVAGTSSSSVSMHTQRAGNMKKAKKIVCYSCQKQGHKANKCPNVQKRSMSANSVVSDSSKRSSFAMSATSENVGPSESVENIEFIIDSGCTDHIINKENLVTQASPIHHSINTEKEGESMSVSNIGKVPITTRVDGREKYGQIGNVMVVPSSRQNLLSVSQVDKKG